MKKKKYFQEINLFWSIRKKMQLMTPMFGISLEATFSHWMTCVVRVNIHVKYYHDFFQCSCWKLKNISIFLRLSMALYTQNKTNLKVHQYLMFNMYFAHKLNSYYTIIGAKIHISVWSNIFPQYIFKQINVSVINSQKQTLFFATRHIVPLLKSSSNIADDLVESFYIGMW